MPELLRVVTLSRGGRPRLAFDLASGENYLMGRDTFAIERGERETQVVRQPGRFGGERAVADRSSNARAVGTWYVEGATADAALANVRTLARELESPLPGRYIEWRPEGASRSVLLERRGAASWQPTYKRAWFRSRRLLGFELSFPVAPVGLGLPMDVLDDFAEDSLADYTLDAGTGTLQVTGGQLVPLDATAKRIIHTVRGYDLGDVQGTLKMVTGASVTGSENGPILKRLGASDYLQAIVRPGFVAVVKVDAGVAADLATAAATLSVSSTVWVRGRIEGDVVKVAFYTVEPTPRSTPAATVSHTLITANKTKFGAGVVGGAGAALKPTGTDWRYDDLAIEPFTYRTVTTPATIVLDGQVPGDVDALVDHVITHEGGAAKPLWALIGHAKRPAAGIGGSPAPFGILQGEDGIALVNWTAQAEATALGGNALLDATVSGAESYEAEWLVDPSVLADVDDFRPYELQVEVWGRVRIGSGLISPRLTVSTRASLGGTEFAPLGYSELGSTGRVVVLPSSGTRWRFTRLGILVFVVDPNRPRRWRVHLDGLTAPASTGVFGLDYLLLAPSHSRAVGPTGKVADTTYPDFLRGTAEATKEIHSDGSGRIASPPDNPHYDHGLGGALPRLAPGANDVLLKLSSLVPDDPTVDADSEQLNHTATYHARCQPRYLMVRD